MKMSEEMAVRLHRMMWSDMQKELGDTPDASDRNRFKEKWCETHFPGEYIHFNCFLCDYCGHDYSDNNCDKCPIEWPDDVCSRAFGQPPAKTDYRFAPISEILALPTRNKELADEKELNKNGSYYEFRKNLLSEYSGLPANFAFAIADHVKAIQKKAVEDFLKEQKGKTGEYLYNRLKKKLADFSGIDDICPVEDHVKRIQEKAVDEYFEKLPAAKLATMDVDNAFKQYAEEQKAPIFRALAEESGLDPTATIKAHINAIYSNGFDDGKDEERERIMDKIGEILKK